MGSFTSNFALLFVSLSCFFCLSLTTDVSYDGRAILINGDRRVLLSGSIHYPRSTPEMWPDLIQKAKDGGLDAIETYIFWNGHEPSRRQYNFEGRFDLVRFLKTINEAGMYAVLRLGPYVCAEWNYGGLPVWLHQMPGIKIRTDNPIFKSEMQNFTTLIVEMLKQEKLFAPQGGPIIIAQIENEYGNWNVESTYGEDGKKYVQWCANLAESFQVGVPWIMCQQWDVPAPLIDTCNGYYCDDGFYPHRNNTPKMWTENWVGWFKAWGAGDNDPHRRAEDVAYAVARFFQTGGTFQNYYMYHGGTNFGRTTGGPYITTTYDYDAPLDEYGNLRQPKWGHLKELHAVIKSMEKVLTNGENSTVDYENGVFATIFNNNGTSGCFLTNKNETIDATISFQGNTYFVPAWSVSILPDCKQEVYNTAKVTTQTSIMVKKENTIEDEPTELNWMWRPENMKDAMIGKSSIVASGLREQILVSGDASDYLWYMTSVNFNANDTSSYGKNLLLRVNTSGHGIHAFLNGKHIGSQYASYGSYQFVFEAPVELQEGTNYLALLSTTVGLTNYGAFFDLVPTGINGGPVQFVKNGKVVKDLTLNKWSYKVGLNGEQNQIFSDESSGKWLSQMLPINSMMTWYKTTFKAPLGEEPVVMDLQGLGKGEAWINGQSIGRYWSNHTSPASGCPKPCDYKGTYKPSTCAKNCGQPSQRWYHVPRSFLKADENTLTLFEELGGNPTGVSFQTITVGTACGMVQEGQTLELSCSHGRIFSDIQYASYGDVQGRCGSFGHGTCGSEAALDAVRQACIGKTSCSIEVSDATLGESNCNVGIAKRLVVQAVC